MNKSVSQKHTGETDVSEEKKPETLSQQEPEQTTSAGDASASAKKTDMLQLPADMKPMEQREPRPDTAQLTLGWRIMFKIGDQSKTLPLRDTIVIGRAVETDNPTEMSFDLTPFGAYHYGVSRRHSVMTLKEGYLYLEDLGSTNGTRINGFQLTAHQKYRLRDGDEVEFARLRTVIQFKSPETP